MNKLHQTVVPSKTLSQRKYRMYAATSDELEQAYQKKIVSQAINPSIVSQPKWLANPEDKVAAILKYLSFLKEEYNAEALVSFVEKKEQKGSFLWMPGDVSSLNLMYKDGKALLSTHSDVIFCDSLWNVSTCGYFGLTIVVVDENYRIRLAAISITNAENQESWRKFFSWVKGLVPRFNPQCVVTDGAPYIYGGFTDVMGDKAQHIVCWWHLREIARNPGTRNKDVRGLLLRMMYASTVQELEYLRDRAKGLVAKLKLRNNQSLLKKIEESASCAFIKLKVFTGGTLTNSFSESMNALLRKHGLNTNYDMISVIQYLSNFIINRSYQDRRPLFLNPEFSRLIAEDTCQTVTKGALSYFFHNVCSLTRRCAIRKADNRVFTVSEEITFVAEDSTQMDKILEWTVDWSNADQPKCSCNGLIYRGIPCQHIALCASSLQTVIPLCCFNKRFYYSSKYVEDDHAAAADTGDGHSEDGDEGNHSVPSVPEDVDGDSSPQMHACFSESSSSSFPRLTSEQSHVVLRKRDEIELYKAVETTANNLVQVRATTGYENQADMVQTYFSTLLDGSFFLLNEMKSSAPTLASVEPSGIIDREDSDHSAAIIVTETDSNQGILDELHITTASVNAKYPSPVFSIFRGALQASIIRLLQLYQRHPTTARKIAQQFQDKVNSLVEECCRNQDPERAVLPSPNGRLTSRSYSDVRRSCWKSTTHSLQKAKQRGAVLGVDSLHLCDSLSFSSTLASSASASAPAPAPAPDEEQNVVQR